MCSRSFVLFDFDNMEEILSEVPKPPLVLRYCVIETLICRGGAQLNMVSYMDATNWIHFSGKKEEEEFQ